MIFKVYVRDFKEGKKVLFSGLKKKTKKNVKLSRDVFQGVSLVRVSGSCQSLKYTPPHRSPFGVIVYFDGEGQYSVWTFEDSSPLLFTWTWWPGTVHVQEPPVLCAASSQFTATRPSREDFAL